MKNEKTKNALLNAYKNTLTDDTNVEISLPIAEGDIITFEENEKLIDAENKIGSNVVPIFNLQDGRQISVSAILTKGNGIGLTGKRSEMLAQFLDKIDEKLSLKVVKRFSVATSYGGKTCYIFKEA